MDKKPQDELEMFIHQELQRLPGLEAPPELLSRVQSALQQQQARSWWRRSWWSWPRPVRTLSLTLFACLGLFCCLSPWLLPLAAGTNWLQEWRTTLSSEWGLVDALWGALTLLLRTLASSPWLWGAAGISLMGYFAVVGLGTFLVRFAARPTYRGADV